MSPQLKHWLAIFQKEKAVECLGCFMWDDKWRPASPGQHSHAHQAAGFAHYLLHPKLTIPKLQIPASSKQPAAAHQGLWHSLLPPLVSFKSQERAVSSDVGGGHGEDMG